METHFNILARKIPGTEEPGGLLELQGVDTAERLNTQKQREGRF